MSYRSGPFSASDSTAFGPPAWILNPSNNLANVDLYFAQGNYWANAQVSDPSTLLTCTRASAGYFFNADGTLSNVGPNTLRIGVGTGLLVEESRTNGIQNNSMQGTVAGTPGTLPTASEMSIRVIMISVPGLPQFPSLQQGRTQASTIQEQTGTG